ncbi:hypothetical protein SDRG_15521 [Saprolegnia diclina VS20]|uniref:Low temperature requirement protein LtrA n=1 Tax=Saprolegnia diclina (strain VS20) TaxID=1156394 RepID=T0R3Q5_SAPDV|nr:hypothetical protein SDRG_15521 [Saprolegnia diclina VS20]EQC26683.1 hypothetical protein SDRG_15521 [Saprolegnia diclina VS20]|eukprot:XP_008619918.1 hypothetical protein SDRG_15521 [Saprolegnia diclina VS20]
MLRTFRAKPTLSANQVGDYEEKVAQWFELFLDLVFVGVCASVAHHLEAHVTWHGVCDFIFLLTQYTAGWLLYTNFVSRFNETSLVHCVFLFVLLCGFGGMVLGGSPNQAFTTGLLLVRLGVLCMNANMYLRLPASRQQVWLDLVLLLCSIGILGVGLTASTTELYWCYGAVLFLEIPVRGIWMINQWLFATSVHVYINIDHANERASNLVLVTLGEAVLAAIQNNDDADRVTPRFYLCMLLSLVVSFGLALFYHTVQPPRPFHALKRSATFAFGFYMVHFALWPSLVALGVGTAVVKRAVLAHARLDRAEIYLLFGSLSASMLCILLLRLLHYGGRQPTSWDAPRVRALKQLWWAIIALSPVHAILDAVVLLYCGRDDDSVDSINALLAAAATVVWWIVVETAIMGALLRLGGQFKLHATDIDDVDDDEPPASTPRAGYRAYDGLV